MPYSADCYLSYMIIISSYANDFISIIIFEQ